MGMTIGAGIILGEGMSYVFPPTYAVAPIVSSVNEGSSLIFNVTTTNVSNGSTLYWSVSNASDFSVSSGSFSISSNIGSFTVTPTADSTTEGSETFVAYVRTDSISGPIVATSETITINDTSIASIVTDGLSVYYNIQDSNSYSGTGTTVFDISGNGVNASKPAAITYVSNDGPSLAFPANNTGSTRMSFTYSIPTNWQFTIAYWVKYNSDSNSSMAIWSQGIGNNSVALSHISTNLRKITFNKYTSSGVFAPSSSALIVPNTWVFLAVVFGLSGSNLTGTFYINGQTAGSLGSINNTVRPSGSQFIGGRIQADLNSADGFKGQLKQFMIYSRQLSAAEILQNYNATV